MLPAQTSSPSKSLSETSSPPRATESPESPKESPQESEEIPADQEDDGSEYWTCSECAASPSGSWYTCLECLEIQELFHTDSTRSPSEEELTLAEILQARARSRSTSKEKGSKFRWSPGRFFQSRSLSLSPEKRKEFRKARSHSISLARRLTKKEALGFVRSQSSAVLGKKEGPYVHPEGVIRSSRKPSRSNSLTKEIVASFKEFKDKVTRGRFASKSREEERIPSPQNAPSSSSHPEQDQDVPIPVQVVTRRKDSEADELTESSEGWKEVSQKTVTTRVTLQSSTGEREKTLTMEHTESMKIPIEEMEIESPCEESSLPVLCNIYEVRT